MLVSIPASYRFKPAVAEGDLELMAAAELQHVGIHALRAAMGWHDGTFSVDKYNQLLGEESARIDETTTWREYMRTSRAGSRFRLDRRTRGAIFVVIKTTRVLNKLGAL